MSNPPKQRGTAAESAVVKAALRFGIHAERRALKGAADEGDVWLAGGRAVVEVKSRRKWWTWREVGQWWVETEKEAARVTQADIAVLVVKRPGSARAEDWFAWARHDELEWALRSTDSSVRQVVMMPLGDLLAAMASSGLWGVDDQ